MVVEITAILEARGYIVKDIFLNFDELTAAKQHDVVNFENAVAKGKKNIEGLYSKLNVTRLKLE